MSEPISFQKGEAEGMAIRVEDAMKTLNALLDGAEASIPLSDSKRRVYVLMARDRARHLEWVAYRLRGGCSA